MQTSCGRSLPLVMLAAVALVPAARAQAPCDATTQYAYTFQSWCAEPIWIGQRSTADPTAYPPQSGNWALAGRCTANAQCASGACDANSGQCTCGAAADCPGGAPCLADGKCASEAVFCVPKQWSSGVFWPRTGCTLDAAASPATLACATGACFATDNSGRQLLDCSAGNGGGSPTNPVTQFEVTSTATSVNYDVSLAAGYNVETYAVPVGGGQVVPGTPATDVVACYPVGCTADLNATCPAALRVLDGGAVVGCLDPCTRCQRADVPASLQCATPRPETWTCGSDSGAVTYQDLYCAKNTADGSPQASPNQGTPTAFGPLDCPPATTFVVPAFAPGYALPPGQGVCLYTAPPQSTIPTFNDYRWADAGTGGAQSCGDLPDGTPCGGYRTAQTGGGYYPDAIGYTCRTATYPVSDGGMQTAHLCMPPATSGLGACTTDTLGELPLYSAGAGVANQAWLDAAVLAGGGTPYYVPFKTACQAAYAWQYDDIASGFSCQAADAVAGGTTFSGFSVTFCGSAPQPPAPPGPPGPVPSNVVALVARGHANRLERPARGLVRVNGHTTLPPSVALEETSVTLVDLLDEVGRAGELLEGASLPVAMSPRKRKKKVAIFEAASGDTRLRLVLRRPRPKKERVKVQVIAKRATIARPAECPDKKGEARLETAFLVGAGPDWTRVGTIGDWRCRKQVLRGK